MRWGVVLALVVAGCVAAQRYAVVRPGLDCDRATRVAYRAMRELGYRVTELVPPEGERPGVIRGEKETPEGTLRRGADRVLGRRRGAAADRGYAVLGLRLQPRLRLQLHEPARAPRRLGAAGRQRARGPGACARALRGPPRLGRGADPGRRGGDA